MRLKDEGLETPGGQEGGEGDGGGDSPDQGPHPDPRQPVTLTQQQGLVDPPGPRLSCEPV